MALLPTSVSCVGVANNQYLKVNDMWYVFLTAYSDTTKYQGLTFRIWDASTGTVYSATPSNSITFESDKVNGSIGNPIVFDATNGYIQNISLKEGWNWISFNVYSDKLSNPNELLKASMFCPISRIKCPSARSVIATGLI